MRDYCSNCEYYIAYVYVYNTQDCMSNCSRKLTNTLVIILTCCWLSRCEDCDNYSPLRCLLYFGAFPYENKDSSPTDDHRRFVVQYARAYLEWFTSDFVFWIESNFCYRLNPSFWHRFRFALHNLCILYLFLFHIFDLSSSRIARKLLLIISSSLQTHYYLSNSVLLLVKFNLITFYVM